VSLVADVEVRRGAFAVRAELRAEPHEVVAVLGPNGAGKTTLLRALAGLEPVDTGSVQVGDRTLDDSARHLHVPTHERRVGLVFADYRLFDHLSALENVAYGLRAQGIAKQPARDRAAGWLDRVGLTAFARRRTNALSGGQRQRVALARTLAAEPDLVLLDEPLSALDVTTRARLRSEVREHLLAAQVPCVLVTHDPVDAMVLADRLVVLEDGAVTQTGPPAEVAARPRTPYAAGLVGLNLLRGTASAGVVHVDGPDLVGPDLVGPELVGPDPRAEGPVLVLISPSAVVVHMSRPPAGSPRNVWPAEITGVETLGDRVRLATTGPPDLLVDVTPAALAELRLDRGRRIWLSVKASAVTLLSAP